MRAMAVRGYGSPLEPVDLPELELRPGCAQLEVLTCGVSLSDVMTSRGLMPFSSRLTLPHVPGHKISADVVRRDPLVLAPGTVAVAYHPSPCRTCTLCRAGRQQLCRDPWGVDRVHDTGRLHPYRARAGEASGRVVLQVGALS